MTASAATGGTTTLPLSITPYGSFSEASVDVLRMLQAFVGMGTWMITRTDDDDWTVLSTTGNAYEIQPGTVMRWGDSFCSRMVRGEAPNIAPDSQSIVAYRDAAIGRELKIRAYVGVPIARPDGSLFGTMCAIDPVAQPESIVEKLPVIETAARLMSTILAQELSLQQIERESELLKLQSLTDSLTGLFNRRAWDLSLEREESRIQRSGAAASVVVIDLDEFKKVNDLLGHAAGDVVLRNVAKVLLEHQRAGDVVARLGGDEFGILAVDTDATGVRALAEKVRARFAGAGIAATVGSAARTGRTTLEGAWHAADEAMYEGKQSR